MKPTHEEVIEGMAGCIPIGRSSSEVRRIAAQAVLRALQDMMPDAEETKPLNSLNNARYLYNHFKTLGRDNV